MNVVKAVKPAKAVTMVTCCDECCVECCEGIETSEGGEAGEGSYTGEGNETGEGGEAGDVACFEASVTAAKPVTSFFLRVRPNL